jgi:PIN domain nuclease of toxin-antitoxin system
MEGFGVKYLLDTSPWINGVTLPHVFPPRIRRLLESDETLGLCSISLLEAAILYRLGRMEFDTALSQFFAIALAEDLEILEITPAIALATNNLPDDFAGDPFDRTIVSTAAVLNLTLITPDRAIRDARTCAVEYYPFKPSRSGC